MTLAETTLRYMKDQTLENFMALRQQVAATPNYSPYDSYESKVYPLFQKEQYQEAVSRLKTMMPGWLLSPGLHSLLAYAHNKLGETEETQQEATWARLAVDGIQKTGDGSQARPYLVLQISDEYDVLKYLGKKTVGQKMVRQADQICDLHTCEDGSEIWFDITIPFTYQQQQLQASRPAQP